MSAQEKLKVTIAPTIKLSLPFFILGASIGHLAGISSAEVTIPIISGLLTFVGGASVIFFTKIATSERSLYGLIISGLCIGLLTGVYSGLLVLGTIAPELLNRTAGVGLLRNNKEELISPYIKQYRQDSRNWSSEELEARLRQLLDDYDRTQ